MGFRLDASPSDRDTWMVAGAVSKFGRHDSVGYPIMPPLLNEFDEGHTDDTAGFVQARWTRTNSAGNESSLQFSYDKSDLSYPFIDGDLNNLTVDFQKRVQTGDRNEVYWGAGYQQYWDYTSSKHQLQFMPADSVYRVGDVVLRDEFQIVPNRLLVSAGARVDYNSYTRFEVQPSFRLLYTPSARQSVWMALSRAVRVPSRIDRDMITDEGARLMMGVPVISRSSDRGPCNRKSSTAWKRAIVCNRANVGPPTCRCSGATTTGWQQWRSRCNQPSSGTGRSRPSR